MYILKKIKKQLALIIPVIAIILINGCNKEEAEKDENSYKVALEYDTSSGDVAVDPVMEQYPENTRITFTATPKAGYKFMGWKSNGVIISTEAEISMNVDSNVNVVAYFESDASATGDAYVLNVSYDDEKGDIVISPDKFTYEEGESVTITATPKDGYKFKEWQGMSGTSNVLKIDITGDENIKAIFEEAGNSNETTSDIIFNFEGFYDEEDGFWKFTASLEDDSRTFNEKQITKAVIKINDVQMDMEGARNHPESEGEYYNMEVKNLGPDEVLNISVKYEDIYFTKTIKTPPYFTEKRSFDVVIEDQKVIFDWQALDCNGYLVFRSVEQDESTTSEQLTISPISGNHYEASRYSVFNSNIAIYPSPDRLNVWVIPVNFDVQMDGFHEGSSIKLEGKKSNVMYWDLL